MSLALYWNIISQPSRSVKALIDLGKLQAKLNDVDLLSNETHTKEYLELNPFGKVPFLTHEDFKLAQSNAILVYLCEAFPEKLSRYYGDTPRSRAKVNQYLSWYQNSFRPGLFRIIQHKVDEGLKLGLTVHSYQIKQAERQMSQMLQMLDNVLEIQQSPYIAGEHLTIADLQFFHQLTNMLVYEMPFTQYEHVTEWYNRVLLVPEIKDIHSQFQKIIPLLVSVVKNVKVESE